MVDVGNGEIIRYFKLAKQPSKQLLPSLSLFSMQFRSGVAACSRPCRPTPRPAAPPAAVPPDNAQSLLTPPQPLPPPLPPFPPLLPLSPLLPLPPPPARQKRGRAPPAKMPPHTVDEENEVLILYMDPVYWSS